MLVFFQTSSAIECVAGCPMCEESFAKLLSDNDTLKGEVQILHQHDPQVY